MSDYLQKQINEIDKKIEEARQLASADPSMAEIAADEIKKLEEQKEALGETPEQSIGGNQSSNSLILEIRAAAGGDEAGLFAQDLARMYTKFAANNNWKVEELDKNEGGLGNLKEVTFKISGKDAYAKLQFESGVHRVQRVPKTESSGRIHTSTATVAVLPEVSATQVEINPKDLEFAAFRSGGHGGQNVNKVSTAVRIKHKPSALVVKSSSERSQAQNREIAMEILRSKLYQMEKENQSVQLGNLRQAQVGAGDRSEKIRTYNYPQDRVTDHRIPKSWGNINTIMDGGLGKIIESLKNLSSS